MAKQDYLLIIEALLLSKAEQPTKATEIQKLITHFDNLYTEAV